MQAPAFRDAIAATALAGALCAAAPHAHAGPTEAKIEAAYKLSFRGFNLGKFSMSSNLAGGQYSMTSETRLRLLWGMVFKLTGAGSSSGAMRNPHPRPGQFALSFKTKKKHAALVMQFKGSAVEKVDMQPEWHRHPRAVPVTDAHMRGVLDPLSAFLIAAKPGLRPMDAKVCDRRLPIYDGKHRYDLQLSQKRVVQVKRANRGDMAGQAVVCKVKYTPIAGHKRHNKNLKFMAETEDIEAWLIRVPSTDIYLPYHLSIPTPYGFGSATISKLEVETAGKKYALVR